MTQQKLLDRLSRDLKPLCPRHLHVMTYEPERMGVQGDSGDLVQPVSSYHCGYMGCSVRYNPAEGYFTVIDTPDVPSFVEEPGVNLLLCPRHGTWLYRCKAQDGEELIWRCGVAGCDYSHADAPGAPVS